MRVQGLGCRDKRVYKANGESGGKDKKMDIDTETRIIYGVMGVITNIMARHPNSGFGDLRMGTGVEDLGYKGIRV